MKSKRKKLGLTQAELAQKAGLSVRHIGKLEDGTYTPKLTTYLKLSEILGLNATEINSFSSMAENKEQMRIIELLNDMDNDALRLSYNFLKTIINSKGEEYA